MPVVVANVQQSTWIVIAVFLTAILLSFRKTQHKDLFPVPVTQELKGLGMLAIVFAHISYMLVDDNRFLYPLSIAAGVGVDLFLFMSGYGLTVGMMKRQLPIMEFFHRRIVKVFIPFWLVIAVLFAADPLIADRHYSVGYMLQSLLGYFPTAIPTNDVNSPFWYITWMLLFYVLYPFLFMRERPWLTAILLAMIANIIAITNPLGMQANWLHSLHTYAFSLGMLLAWWMQRHPDTVKTLEWFRNQSGGVGRYLVLVIGLGGAGYMASHNAAVHWPSVSSMLETLHLDKGNVIGQSTSLLAMAGALLYFSFKKLDNRLLYWFGVYSYETYLLHWPLMSRYDVFFRYLPAWAATLVWLAAFLAIGWAVQRVTTPIGAWVDRQGNSR